MPQSRRGAVTLNVALIAGALAFGGFAAVRHTPRSTIPDRLADSTFWRMVTTFSEPSGTFPSENFVSNETEWQYVVPNALQRVKPGGVYLGVGPEQNFTYMAAFHPALAFICDIRRQNLIQHLMYKALIEMSSDRVDFLSRLWSRSRPDALDSSSSPGAIAAAYRKAKPDSLLHDLNTAAMFAQLVHHHKFALNSEDSATLKTVYDVFFRDGPDISYASSSGRSGGMPISFGLPNGASAAFGGAVGTNGMIWYRSGGPVTVYRMTRDSAGNVIMTRDSAGVAVRDSSFSFRTTPFTMPNISIGGIGGIGGRYATFGSLMSEDDGEGVNRGWLGSEAAFQWLKDFESRNLLVPIVGDFGGTHALRSVAGYLKANSAEVTTFYTSNVEQYLFQHGIADDFYDNVAALPADLNAIFIRSFPPTVQMAIRPLRAGTPLAQSVSSIGTVVRAHASGKLLTYADLADLQDR